MTRKHFQLIADALKDAKPLDHWDANKHAQWEVDVKRIAEALRSSNPRFDRIRFMEACGLNKEVAIEYT